MEAAETTDQISSTIHELTQQTETSVATFKPDLPIVTANKAATVEGASNSWTFVAEILVASEPSVRFKAVLKEHRPMHGTALPKEETLSLAEATTLRAAAPPLMPVSAAEQALASKVAAQVLELAWAAAVASASASESVVVNEDGKRLSRTDDPPSANPTNAKEEARCVATVLSTPQPEDAGMYSTISRRIRSPMKEAMPKVKVKATRADAVHVLPSSAKSGRIRTPLKEALPVVKVKPHDASLENSWAASPRELQHVTASRALLWPWSTQLDDGRGVVGYVGNTVSQRLQLRRASATPDPTQQGKLSKSASTSLLPARQSRATSGARSSLTDLRPRGLGEKASLSGWGRANNLARNDATRPQLVSPQLLSPSASPRISPTVSPLRVRTRSGATFVLEGDGSTAVERY